MKGVIGLEGALKMQAHKQTEMLDQTFTHANKSLGRIISPLAYMSANGGSGDIPAASDALIVSH